MRNDDAPLAPIAFEHPQRSMQILPLVNRIPAH
jgi:hypothetical protein